MTYPKIRGCPRCGGENMAVYSYENGWRHVECDDCIYLGPGEGNITQAIHAHNASVDGRPKAGDALAAPLATSAVTAKPADAQTPSSSPSPPKEHP